MDTFFEALSRGLIAEAAYLNYRLDHLTHDPGYDPENPGTGLAHDEYARELARHGGG